MATESVGCVDLHVVLDEGDHKMRRFNKKYNLGRKKTWRNWFVDIVWCNLYCTFILHFKSQINSYISK